jgi:thiamine transport system ATP-binding protein
VMRSGRIEAEGPPEMVWAAPRTAFVARFLGQQVVPLAQGMPGAASVAAATAVSATVATPWGPLTVPATAGRPADGPVGIAIRPDAFVPDADGAIRGRVVDRVFRGDHVRVRLAPADDGPAAAAGELPATLEVHARFPVPSVGEELRLGIDPSRVSLVRDDAASG